MSENSIPDLEEVTQRVKALSDQVTEQARQNGLAWLEGYERVLTSLLELEQQAAKGTGVDWLATLATTQANFVRETSSAFIGAVRSQLEKK